MDINLNPQEYLNRAIQAYQMGQLDQSERLLRDLLEAYPTADQVMCILGGVLTAKGQPDEGIEQIEKALKINPNNQDAWFNLSSAHLAKKQPKAALKSILKVCQLNPRRADAHYNRANILLELKQTKEAEKAYKRALKFDPKLTSAQFNLGNLYYYDGEIEEAKKAYRAALNTDSKFRPALKNLGNILADEGVVEEAAQLYQRIIEAYPNQVDGYEVLGKLYLDQGDIALAEETLEKIVELKASSTNAYVLLGNAYNEQSKTQKAEEAYQKALEIDPKNEGAERNLRRIWSAQIPGWHFTMLADEKRNAAYQKAIEKAVTKEDTVVDIGTGTGLLAMMAAKAGAQKVIACEMHGKLAEVAKEIVDINKFSKQINIISKKSTQMKVGEDLPEAADVLISEILDVGVIGEGVLPTLRHAHQALLKEDVQIIPERVALFAQLIEIPDRARINPIHRIAGFDLSPFDQFRIPNEYTAVYLQKERYKPLSEVIPMLDYDFYNLPPAISDNLPKQKQLTFPITATGDLQAVAFWFDLHLDEEISVSTKPGGDLIHWGQALYCFETPQKVEKGNSKTITLLHSDQLIRFEF